MKVSEPVVAYSLETPLHSLKDKVVDLANKSTQIDKLQACVEIPEEDSFPCTYSDEEFVEELRLSEKSGLVSDAEFVASCKERWGVEL